MSLPTGRGRALRKSNQKKRTRPSDKHDDTLGDADFEVDIDDESDEPFSIEEEPAKIHHVDVDDEDDDDFEFDFDVPALPKPQRRVSTGFQQSRRKQVLRRKASLSLNSIQRKLRAQKDQELICVATFRLPFLHATLLAAFGQEEILGLDPAEGMDTQQLVVIPSRDKLAIGAKSLTWQVYSTQTSTVLATWSGSLDELNDLQADAVKFTEELFDALVFCFSHDIVSFRAVSLQDSRFETSICILGSAFAATTAFDEPAAPKERSSIRRLLQWAYPDVHMPMVPEDVSERGDFNPAELYEMVRGRDEAAAKTGSILAHPGLKSKLRAYQSRAVKWMIARENREDLVQNDDESFGYWVELSVRDHGFDGEQEDFNRHKSPAVFYFSSLSGCLARLKDTRVFDIRGGILADEMGLGKTIEVISLIMLNPPTANHLALHEANPAVDVTMKEEEEEESADIVKCYCGDDSDVEDSESFVQCELCRTWQHSVCVAFDPSGHEASRRYFCPECSATSHPLPIKATLIVCPDTILHQWQEEIEKHVATDGLNVLVYSGVRGVGLTRNKKLTKIVRPSQFDAYDVVLTTYAALREDLGHTSVIQGNEKTKRYVKKYRAIPTPLTAVTWWRVCLDESQMLGEGSAAAATMANNLNVINRWGVSGTPIQKGLEDLYGLFLFLAVHPYSNRAWWKPCLQEPYLADVPEAVDRMESLTRRLLWRTNKQDALHEVELPPLTDNIGKVKFSEVEEFLYRKRHDDCSYQVRSAIDRYGKSSTGIPHGSMKKIMNSVLTLRQMCCHPQLGSKTGLQSLAKCTMTMPQLLDQLIIKARVECEESQRLTIMNNHGLAAIAIIEKDIETAARLYRETLSPDHQIEVDALQKIHAMHNLQFVIKKLAEADKAGVSNIMRDEELRRLAEQEKQFSENFLIKFRVRQDESRYLLERLGDELESAELHVKNWLNDSSWWYRALSALWEADAADDDFILRIKSTLGQEAESTGMPSITARFKNLVGLRVTIMTELDNIDKRRQLCLENIDALSGTPVDTGVIEEILACSRCRGTRNKDDQPAQEHPLAGQQTQPRRRGASLYERDADQQRVRKIICRFCRVEESLIDYERSLFVFKQLRKKTTNEEQEALNKMDSEIERILSRLASYLSGPAKSRFHPEDIEDFAVNAELHMRTFAVMKKEIKQCRLYWSALYDAALGRDELDQCKSRVRLRFPDEEVEEWEAHMKIHDYEVRPSKIKFEAEKATYEADMRQHLSQLAYLEGLSKKSRSLQPTAEKSMCPICQENIKEEVVVWACGHEVCPPCMLALLERAKHKQTVKCPSCRGRMNVNEVTYVKKADAIAFASNVNGAERQEHEGDKANQPEQPREVNGAQHVEVKGSWGSKIESVLLTLLKLFDEDPLAKVLLFSSWNDVLMVVGQALKDNGISYIQLSGDKVKTRKSLEKFKRDPLVRVLGMSITKGANGLNLTEATHVVLVEPTLNPAAEAQAVGRIHRIGQTKNTYVYRFLVESTIEERVLALGQQRANSPSQGTATGFGAKQRDADVLDVEELSNLMQIARGDDTDEVNPGDLRGAAENARYWNAKVFINGRWIARSIALATVQHQVFLDFKTQGLQMEADTVSWKGKQVTAPVLERLRELHEQMEDDKESLDD